MTTKDKIYDVIVLGGGPAGYTAALYAVRAGLSTLVIEKALAGGQMTKTAQIDNYPGFEDTIEGFILGGKMQTGAERFGTETCQAEILSVQLSGSQITAASSAYPAAEANPLKTIETDRGIFKGRTVIIATGANHKHLGIENEEALIGRGISYCATCDGMFFRNRTVAVVGGGNSAAVAALTLARIAAKVYLIHRRDTLSATKIYHEQLKNTENIEIKWNSNVKELLHESIMTGIKLKDAVTGDEEVLSVDGIFISIGEAPATELFRGQLDLDDMGYIVADETTQTSVPGVFAAGDVRTKALRQIVTAAADGAVAAYYAEEYLREVADGNDISSRR